MSGALVQLSNRGLQDAYLVGAPQMTFFVSSYKRHTNFAVESIQQTPQGQASFGQQVTFVISRTGDLASKMDVEIKLPSLAVSQGTVRWVDDVAAVLMKKYELKIGGTTIDTRYGRFRKMTSTSHLSSEKQGLIRNLWGQRSALTTPAASIPSQTVHYPLDFAFNENYGLSLPSVALAYHEVQIVMNFETLQNCIVYGGLATEADLTAQNTFNASIWIDYIFLEGPERKAYAQGKLEFLFEQLQFTGEREISSTSETITFHFNHPCKEFIWITQPTANIVAKNHFDFSDGSGGDHLVNAKFQFNGSDRQAVRDATYYNKLVPFKHHTNQPAAGIYYQAWGIYVESPFPAGSVNMSRIENSTVQLELASNASCKFAIYAVSYNILRVMSGLGGLAYSS